MDVSTFTSMHPALRGQPTGHPAAELAEAVADVTAALAAAAVVAEVPVRSLRALTIRGRVVVELYLCGGEADVDAVGDALGLQGERDRPGFYVRTGVVGSRRVDVCGTQHAVRRLTVVTS